MRAHLFRLIVLLLICLMLPLTATAQVVDIPDPNLRAAIETELGKASGVTITAADMATLTKLFARDANITDLTGLEYATGLTKLRLGLNNISDISAVSGLTNLTFLDLHYNSISDISPVAGLTNLTKLIFWNNSISDISAVSGLTNLTYLHLAVNSISDISAVSGLTDLRDLRLQQNNISDISALSGLTNLIYLRLWGNNISDLSPVAGLTNLRYVDFFVNNIWDISPVSDLTNLTGLTIFDYNIDSNISDLSPVAGLTNLTYLQLYDNLSNNSISDISAVSGLTNLTFLQLSDNRISDISAVSGLTNLTKLLLYDNNISDIAAVASLTKLTELWLGDNNISDISVVSGLTNLTELYLSSNPISDLSVVSGLTNLTVLWLPWNNVSDISPVSGLTNLTELGLSYGDISDISAVSGLTNLTLLQIHDNRISDLSPLVANTGLGDGDEVKVQRNPLSYASIHTHIPTLQGRGVTVEFDNQAHPALLKISGDNQTGAAGAVLTTPFVVEAQDENGAALLGISVAFTVTVGGGTLSVQNTTTDANGRAQSTLTLGPNLGTNTVSVTADGIENQVTFNAISDTELPPIAADVNGDGVVNVLDLISVAISLEDEGANLTADVNGDGVVSLLDLVLVAGMFESTAAAPSARLQVPETLTAVEVQQWLTDARSLKVSNPIIKRGFIVLEQLLASLIPTTTELLPNYPNPFNPETWIPYRLAEDAFVTLTIYDLSGQVVRMLEVGHRMASTYESRSKAIYWDGRNQLGEPVASGVYYYHLSAGDYAATRKMLVVK